MKPFRSVAHICRELQDNVKFRDLDKPARNVVFYAEDSASYNYFEGLINRLLDYYRIAICYFTSDPADPVFATRRPLLNVFYVKHLLSFFTGNLEADILVMTMPDLHRLHVKRSKHPVNHLYLFHNIGSSFPVIRYGALFHYDTIFCVGDHHKQEVKRQEDLYRLPQKKTSLNSGTIGWTKSTMITATIAVRMNLRRIARGRYCSRRRGVTSPSLMCAADN